MRLHRLEITAFGPFAGTETVDFDALADGGLFLFTGPTGAGKTSVLDAACFALYGQVPGARGGSRGLRSDHAGEGVAPEVVLEVSLRGRRLRLTRSPQWERPKRRGSGTLTEQSRVHLQERSPAGWTTLSTRLDETGHLVGGLLGLTLAQFCQVVLLPQGQFADFLRADAEKRRELLESLFDTGRFTAVERWLVARRQDTARDLDDADERLRQVLARIGEAAGHDAPDDLEPARSDRWVAALVEQARSGRATAQEVAAHASDRHDAATAALEAATLVAEAHTRRSALKTRLVQLTEQSALHDAAAVEIAAARSAAPLMPLVEEVGRLQVELEQARAVASATGLQLAEALPATGTDSVPLSAIPWPAPGVLQAVARDHRGAVGGLRTMAKDEVEADRLAAATDALERRVVELDDQAQRLAALLDSAPARRIELEATRDASQAAIAALPGARTAIEVAQERLTAADQRDALLLRRAAAADDLRGCTDAAQLAREQWLGLRQARLDGMAAELAAVLHDGDDCPVCGSTEHPRPAQAAPGAVSKDAEDVAAAEVAELEVSRIAAAETVATLAAALAAARSAAGGDTPLPDLRAAHAAAAAEVTRLTALAAGASGDQGALQAFAEQHEGWVRQRVSLDQDAKNLRGQVAGDRERLQALRATLDGARGDDRSIAARAARLARLADELESLARQVSTVEQLSDQVTAALERAEHAARERGIGSLDEVFAAHRDDDVVARLDDARQRHLAELSSVADQLAEPSLSVLADSPVPDLAALRAQVRDTQAANAEAAGELATAARRVDALLRLGAVLRAVLAERGPLADQHRTVDALSRLAEGKSTDNRLRMSLSGYVLAARLEQVALAASERLGRMSSGRYQLLHSAQAGSARARGGLHLRVLAAWTGVERDPASLSGGETFSASLALALGLADVVTAEAGGTLLETLFVDEGFGSLDDDTLDDVMGVLDGLRDGGRTVGIVSHVTDLRQRIPVQLRVEKGRTGSHVRQ
jgi:exonuclease SbcC